MRRLKLPEGAVLSSFASGATTWSVRRDVIDMPTEDLDLVVPKTVMVSTNFLSFETWPLTGDGLSRPSMSAFAMSLAQRRTLGCGGGKSCAH